MLAAGALALIVGAFVVRLGGIAFMMVTLAIGQMAHAYFFRNRELGGDDGLGGTPRPDLTALGLDMANAAAFSAYAVVLAAAAYAAFALVVRSPFGHALGAIRQNERRMAALGCAVRGHKLGAYATAAGGAGLAGSLLAQQSGFVSPELMFWTVSGEALIMVIVGGMGSIIGAAAGAAVIVLMRDTLSSLTEFWLLGMGLFFIAVVAFARRGIHGAAAVLLHILGVAGRLPGGPGSGNA
jgi:branched-chain amino acid transport system permease protein